MGILNIVTAKPKIALAIAATVIIGGYVAHYKYLQGKVDRLTTERDAIQAAYNIAVENIEKMAEDARIAEEATRQAIAEREAARAALDEFRRGRENDAEAAAWGAQLIPLGELERMCVALPEMDGCPSTPETN